MLEDFVVDHREEIIARCRTKVAARTLPPPSAAEADYGVPLFLSELVDALQRGLSPSSERSVSAIGTSATLHGNQMRRQGFTVSQVVHDYGDICQSITELAVETQAPISTDDFRVLNRCLDDAIAGAVTEYGRRARISDIDDTSARGNERLGFLAHELRNLIQTALVAFEVLKTGNVGVAGATGGVLYRSLVGTRDLIARSVTEVRLTQGVYHREHFLVSRFIEEIATAATLAAEARNLILRTTVTTDEAVTIEGDRQILAAALTNVLQNAFKFTRPDTTVVLRVRASTERVLFEVQDECGGLAAGNVDDLFHPFEQRGTDRTGLGLGLAFSRWAIEANHGRLYARNLPAVGCVFTIDLPRVAE
jgi:signal transduction histidine kinase